MSKSWLAEPQVERTLLADAMTLVPSDNATPYSNVSIATLLHNMHAGLDESRAKTIVDRALRFLNDYGVLTKDHAGYRASSSQASYFMRSLAWYVAQGERIPVSASKAPNSTTTSKHLRALEQRRLEITTQRGVAAPALRRQSASLVLIKACANTQTCYLHQYDLDASQYQLIGGRLEPGEAAHQAARRELLEEVQFIGIPEITLVAVLAEDHAIRRKAISPTFGILTDYTLHIFGACIFGGRVQLGKHDCWLTVSEMLEGRTHSGEPIADSTIAHEINNRIEGGLEALNIAPTVL